MSNEEQECRGSGATEALFWLKKNYCITVGHEGVFAGRGGHADGQNKSRRNKATSQGMVFLGIEKQFPLCVRSCMSKAGHFLSLFSHCATLRQHGPRHGPIIRKHEITSFCMPWSVMQRMRICVSNFQALNPAADTTPP